MAKQNTQFDFGDSWQIQDDFVLYDRIIRDRGSVYSVSLGRVNSRDDIVSFVQQLQSHKKYKTADHHSYAARISRDGVIYETKRDDGEQGAGGIILRILQGNDVTNCIVCVTRWFGGIQLMNDRFTHIQDAVVYGLDHYGNTHK